MIHFLGHGISPNELASGPTHGIAEVGRLGAGRGWAFGCWTRLGKAGRSIWMGVAEGRDLSSVSVLGVDRC